MFTRNAEGVEQFSGGLQAVAGVSGAILDGIATTASVPLCVATAGATCVGTAAGVGLTAISLVEGYDGVGRVINPQVEDQGQLVLDSFSQSTHQGDRNPIAEIGQDALAIGAIALGAAGAGRVIDAFDGVSDVAVTVSRADINGNVVPKSPEAHLPLNTPVAPDRQLVPTTRNTDELSNSNNPNRNVDSTNQSDNNIVNSNTIRGNNESSNTISDSSPAPVGNPANPGTRPGGADNEAAGFSEYDQFRHPDNPEWWNYPENNGFVEGSARNEVIPVGTRLDRYGDSNGNYLAPVDTPLPDRALAPGDGSRPITTYEVVRPLPAQVGETAPAFTQSGGGTQIYNPTAIRELIRQGYLVEVTE